MNTENYFRDRVILLQSLSEQAHWRAGYADSYYPYPVLLDPKEISVLEKLQGIVSHALECVVRNYFHDRRISSLLSLENPIAEQLWRLEAIPYHLDFARPDFLYDRNGDIRVCEVNARFILNGLIMSIYMDKAFSSLFEEGQHLSGIADLESLLRTSFSGEVSVLKGREAGYDIHFLQSYSSQVVFFPLEESAVFLQRNSPLILELHQDELKTILPFVVDAFLSGKKIYNDPRTLYLIHDRRLFSILSNTDIMKEYLSADHCALLSQAIIPTFLPGVHTDIIEQAKREKDHWLAKKTLSGKCQGLVLGFDTGPEEWEQVLGDQDYVLQPSIEQKEFFLWQPYFRKYQSVHLAGTLPLVHGKAFGPGLFRAHDSKTVSFLSFVQALGKT